MEFKQMNLGTLDVGITISAAGTTQATATLLFNGANWITTAAVNSGVVLSPVVVSGANQLVYNGTANPLSVYPCAGSKINALAINAAHVLAPGTACNYFTLSSTQIVGILSA